jgi:hypothetical protein
MIEEARHSRRDSRGIDSEVEGARDEAPKPIRPGLKELVSDIRHAGLLQMIEVATIALVVIVLCVVFLLGIVHVLDQFVLQNSI